MFTDMVGYVALMGTDEAKAMKLVHRNREIQRPLIEKHGGTWLKEMGDGVMASFQTVSHAIYCATEIQKQMKLEQEIKLRIGIHLGEIMIENGDIFGDGVNIASRLQTIAEPGGIYISDAVQKAVRSKSDIKTAYLGELELKNVGYPVKTYAVRGESLPRPKRTEEKDLSGRFVAELIRRGVLRAGLVYLAFAFILYLLSKFFIESTVLSTFFNGMLILGIPISTLLAWRYEKGPSGFIRVTSREAWENPYSEGRKKPFTGNLVILILLLIIVSLLAYPIINSGSKDPAHINRSLAILPFDDMSPQKDQQYFSDGVMDEILSRLSKISDLRLISRTTMENYRETNKAITLIADELNVGYVLEGSIQRIEDKVRIIVQLINGEDDSHVWSESYMRDIEDIFRIQTEISKTIAHELNIQLGTYQRDQLSMEPTSNLSAYDLSAYDYYLRAGAVELIDEGQTNQAISLYRQAINLDPQFALAYAKLAGIQKLKRTYGKLREVWYDSSLLLINRALDLEPDLAEAFYERAELNIEDNNWEQAEKDLAKVIQLDPNNVNALNRLGNRKISQGDFEEGVRLVFEAWSRQTIDDLEDFNSINSIAIRYYRIGELDSAFKLVERSLEINPVQPDLLNALAGVATNLGFLEISNDYYRRLLTLNPENYFAMRELARNLTWLGEYEEAIELFEKSDQVIKDFEQTDKVPSSSHRLGYALVETGDSVRGWEIINKVFDESLERVEKGHLHNYAGEFYDLAAISAYRNNIDDGLYWIKRCINEGWYSTAFLKYDPMLENIRDDKIISDIIDSEEENTRALQIEFQKQYKELESKGQFRSIRTR
jgi:TolB-like protein/Tfp pilus assembly protein PilF